MSAPQFTPGPYEAEPSDHLGAHAYAIKASDGDFLAVGCTLWDAYLFAAAPSLFEALFKLSFAAQTTGGTAGRDAGLIAAIDEAKTALAKALGQ